MRGNPSIADGGGERLEVAQVLVGVGDGELGDRAIARSKTVPVPR